MASDRTGRTSNDVAEKMGTEGRLRDEVARILHDLRGPLVLCRHISDMLIREGITADPAQQRRRVANLQAGLDILLRLTDRLDMFHNREWRVKSSEPVLLAAVLSNVSRTIRAGSAVPIEIWTTGEEKIPPLAIEMHQLQQVLFNVLSNAAKYGQPAQGKVHVEVRCSVDPDAYRISVCDWGIGIPHGWEATIFEEGVRAPNAKRLSVEGMGTGLFLANRILQDHGGSVEVSHFHDPTVFTAILPSSMAWTSDKRTVEKPTMDDLESMVKNERL